MEMAMAMAVAAEMVRKGRKERGNKLNAMIPAYAVALGSEMQADLEPLEEIAMEEFNFMSEEEVKKAFKKKGQFECILYFAREMDDERNWELDDPDGPSLQMNSL